jgi:tyrosyl-tRNA synthetase
VGATAGDESHACRSECAQHRAAADAIPARAGQTARLSARAAQERSFTSGPGDADHTGYSNRSMTLDEQLRYLTKGCIDVVRREELRTKLARSGKTGTPLVVKVGFDPTAPDLHLGHTVLIRKMKHFQDLGHTVIFVIGDFTGLIGDPTGRSKTRPPLTRAEIDANAETYKQQVFKLLDPVRTVVDYNNRWFGSLTSEEWVRLAARYNVAQMLERRDFKQRHEAGQPIALHEFLYPLVQAYDSVVLRADVEMGGTDQLFNLNVGRDVMPSFGLEPQIVMTVPLLVGIDGVEKMSKSTGNYVGVSESASVMFGKLMSISDEVMWTYFELLTDLTSEEIGGLRADVTAGVRHPKQVKVELATRIVSDFHSPEAAAQAAGEFERVHVQGHPPETVPEVEVRKGAALAEPGGAAAADAGGVVFESDTLSRILVKCGLAASGADATRKIKQGAVRIDGDRVTEFTWRVPGPGSYLVQVGPRAFVRLIVTE